MSDTEPQTPEPLKPSTKTSTVPLKKETVRITLRARPEDTGPVAPKGSTAPVPAKGGTAPVTAADATGPTQPVAAVPAPPVAAPPSAPSPMAPPSAPPVGGPPPAPSAPRPPAPSAPPAAAAPPAAPGAKTIPLAKKPAAPVPAAAGPVGAKTIPLAKAPTPAGPAVGKQTAPLQSGGAKPLPKATMKLQQTQPMGGGAATSTISKAPDIKSTAAVEEEWEEEFEESGLMPFAIVVLLFAIAVLVIEFLTMTAGK
ncbi:MAG: hypothetical protein KDM63_15210 [Verrucomicrobiae bacterium]|nr:hypothetical protein [Verrucomicrobiae bacterium]MCB1088396.1 hypothetical protein [Verrucomicrobiae bacterium]